MKVNELSHLLAELVMFDNVYRDADIITIEDPELGSSLEIDIPTKLHKDEHYRKVAKFLANRLPSDTFTVVGPPKWSPGIVIRLSALGE